MEFYVEFQRLLVVLGCGYEHFDSRLCKTVGFNWYPKAEVTSGSQQKKVQPKYQKVAQNGIWSQFVDNWNSHETR